MKKELFIKSMNAIKAQINHDDKCVNAISTVFDCAFSANLYYKNSYLQNALVEVLQVAMNDLQDSWIEYFLWELNFGDTWEKGRVTINGKDFKLKTPSDLYDLLTNKEV